MMSWKGQVMTELPLVLIIRVLRFESEVTHLSALNKPARRYEQTLVLSHCKSMPYSFCCL